MIDHPAVKWLAELLAIPSPSGWEAGIAAWVQQKLAEMGYAYESDAAGNVLVRLDGRQPAAPLCVFASHMDEIGFVVTRIEADGRLRVDRSGACCHGSWASRQYKSWEMENPYLASCLWGPHMVVS